MSVAEPPSSSSQRTGLQELKSRGVPDGAITGMLGLLAIVTAAAYLGGLPLGSSSSVPELLNGTQYWIVVAAALPIWAILLKPLINAPRKLLKVFGVKLLAYESLILLASYPMAPITVQRTFHSTLPAGNWSEPFPIELPALSHLRDVAILFRFANPDKEKRELRLKICGNATPPCEEPQIGPNVPFIRQFSSGPATVQVLNFAPPTIDFDLQITYLARRYNQPAHVQP